MLGDIMSVALWEKVVSWKTFEGWGDEPINKEKPLPVVKSAQWPRESSDLSRVGATFDAAGKRHEHRRIYRSSPRLHLTSAHSRVTEFALLLAATQQKTRKKTLQSWSVQADAIWSCDRLLQRTKPLTCSCIIISVEYLLLFWVNTASL